MTEIDLHDSDCATHNEPAYPNGSCDCSISAEAATPDDTQPGTEAEGRSAQNPNTMGAELLAALKEARDLLMERRYGNPARSPGHNARLIIDALITRAEASTDAQPATQLSEMREASGRLSDVVTEAGRFVSKSTRQPVAAFEIHRDIKTILAALNTSREG